MTLIRKPFQKTATDHRINHLTSRRKKVQRGVDAWVTAHFVSRRTMGRGGKLDWMGWGWWGTENSEFVQREPGVPTLIPHSCLIYAAVPSPATKKVPSPAAKKIPSPAVKKGLVVGGKKSLREISSGGSGKQLDKLYRLLERVEKEILRMEEKELGLEELADTNSYHIQETKLKAKAVQIWKAICKIEDRDPEDIGRVTKRKFIFKGT